MIRLIAFFTFLVLFGCKDPKEEPIVIEEPKKETAPFVWEGANLYFLLTDRFNNGDLSNDVNFGRNAEAGPLRGFMGGDIKGITEKLNEGYFTDLGVNAIWITPVVEQIHGDTDEGTGVSYGYHGYWAKDWTSLDPNFGTEQDLKTFVETAHSKGIRVLLDAVINHTGPVTEEDLAWPDEWVRLSPVCNFQNFDGTTACTLVANLPDIRTDSNQEVELPPQLVEKWKAEGRYEKEIEELEAFFDRTKYQRAPRFYIMKWLADYILDYGIDGYRVDTVKHTEDFVWQEFRIVCDESFEMWKENNPDKVIDETPFYMVGEVYNYGISSGKQFDYGDKKVDFYNNAFDALINFDLRWMADQKSTEEVFSVFSQILNSDLKDYGVLSYMTSHDDGSPFDIDRTKPFETGTKLLLAPGAAQIYYGDETARPLKYEGAVGDANLRTFMNWEDVENDTLTKQVLKHFQKLGQFRNNHPSVGGGIHKMISESPYVFSRVYKYEGGEDKVVVAMDVESEGLIMVSDIFENGSVIRDSYSGNEFTVDDGKIQIDNPSKLVLLEQKN
ncbi:alpha-amylase family glycosyl hydrolase [Aegicerativicinus sediminis]|uniref:alpha-amylase family glycosyl hydrolase n=1 Tax=Aegicerativicinus sediminis TaxID=2893202 RepID=UPI001E3D8AFD|nr:alpha-amylase family glycosyl hydrolase [Aegicerativicinus sediminis]